MMLEPEKPRGTRIDLIEWVNPPTKGSPAPDLAHAGAVRDRAVDDRHRGGVRAAQGGGGRVPVRDRRHGRRRPLLLLQGSRRNDPRADRLQPRQGRQVSGVRGWAAVTGVAERKPTRWTDGETTIDMFARIGVQAIADAGLQLADIDGLICHPMGGVPMLVPSTLLEEMGIRANFAETVDLGGRHRAPAWCGAPPPPSPPARPGRCCASPPPAARSHVSGRRGRRSRGTAASADGTPRRSWSSRCPTATSAPTSATP